MISEFPGTITGTEFPLGAWKFNLILGLGVVYSGGELPRKCCSTTIVVMPVSQVPADNRPTVLATLLSSTLVPIIGQ